MAATLYRRPLPDDLVAFSSTEGKQLFREALEGGGMEGWFLLAEQFHTQADPAFCALGSLVVALNALGVDPQRLWKGPWRWFSEELLDCCVSLEEVRARGLTVGEVACLARCNGVSATLSYATDAGPEALRRDVERASRHPGEVVIAAYARTPLGQTGGGHYSPLAGFHGPRDMTLLLDVARFKYPPHWVPVERLHEAMKSVDLETGRSRGWVVLRRHAHAGGVLLSFSCQALSWRGVAEKTRGPLDRWRASPPASIDAVLMDVVDALAAIDEHLEWRAPVDDRHREDVTRLRAALVDSPVGVALAPIAGERTALAAALFYALPLADFAALPRPVATLAGVLADTARLPQDLRAEVDRLREQVTTMRSSAL